MLNLSVELFTFFFLLIWMAVIYFVVVKKNSGRRISETYGRQVEGRNYYLPYKIKKTLMTEHERLLFCNLKIVFESKYDVYPQVNLDKIFYVERQKAYKYYLGWLRRINQKSVDFLIVDKNTQSPVLAIELDDSTHQFEDRIERDKFVQEIFKQNGFPLVRFNPGQYKAEELRIIFAKYLA